MKLLLLLLACISSFSVTATEIVVCKTCEISSIKAAVSSAVDGDTITIKSGIYKEHGLTIKKSVHIKGEGLPVIDAEMKGYAFIIEANNFSIQGIKIIHIGTSHTHDYAAILVSNSHNFRIEDNELQQVFFGILIEKSSNGTIKGNTIQSNAKSQASSGNGVHVWHSKNLQIINNKVSGVRDGIYLEFASNCNILRNICKNNLRYGLHFMFSDHNKYLQNVFQNNGAGVAVMYSKFIEMRGNHFKKNWGSASYGLLLKEISDATLTHNIFEDNTIAISADNTNRIDYLENDFKKNGYAVRIRGACYENRFIRNNFLYNSFDVAYTGNLNENEFLNNYWSDYSGYDLNKDGNGDVPYRPVKLFSYLVNKTPEAIILLRSMFIYLVDFSEKVSPVFTPENLMDPQPQIKKIEW